MVCFQTQRQISEYSSILFLQNYTGDGMFPNTQANIVIE